MKTKTSKTAKTSKIRNRIVFSVSIDDIRTAADQSEGRLSDDCIKNLLAKYDVASDLATVTTEALEEIIADYDEKFGLEYDE